MYMNKICTDVIQSQKLIELGIDVNTADMRYGYIAPYDFSDRMYDGGYDEVPYPKDFLKKNPNFSENEYDGELPAWSLSALLDILAKETRNIDEDGYIVLSSYKGNWWDISPINCVDEEPLEADDPLDVAFEMVCRLLKNKKL